MRNLFSLSGFTLFVALFISTIAAWYSVQGLMTIFAGAATSIMIMGGALELAKITTTIWLHRNWEKAKLPIKTYLTTAVILLACLTSMGIFGLLSKAHSDQLTVKGNNTIQIVEIDRQIQIEKRNIDDAIKVIGQLDQAVQALIDANRIRGSSGSIAVRKSQNEERDTLNQIIKQSNNKITTLEQQKLPLVQEKLNLEAEVGPIKYIAALIYGDNPDNKLLERAVRWVIILLVVVFDPLAIILILAASSSFVWDEERRNKNKPNPIFDKSNTDIDLTLDDTVIRVEPSLDEDQIKNDNHDEPTIDLSKNTLINDDITTKPETEVESSTTKHVKEEPSVKKSFRNDLYSSVKYKLKPTNVISTANTKNKKNKQNIYTQKRPNKNIETENITKEFILPENNYIIYQGKQTSLSALKSLDKNLFNKLSNIAILFGAEFPKVAKHGDIYTRTDVVPHIVYEFLKSKWVEINKLSNTIYLQNVSYIQYLINLIDDGTYDISLLTHYEEQEIKKFLVNSTKIN